MNSRIAIATADGVSVSDHLARATAFIVLEIADGAVVSRGVRKRESGECGNHKTFVQMLEGCHEVICGGIGQGAFDSLAAHGIRSVVTIGKLTVEEALIQRLAGTLAVTGERVCLCH